MGKVGLELHQQPRDVSRGFGIYHLSLPEPLASGRLRPLRDPNDPVARAFALFVLTLAGDHISAITWFADSSVFRQFGLPRMLR